MYAPVCVSERERERGVPRERERESKREQERESEERNAIKDFPVSNKIVFPV